MGTRCCFPLRRGWRSRWVSAGMLAVLALLASGPGSRASAALPDESAVQVTPPRLGMVEGEVLFWRPGATEWEAASVNLPLAPGDALATRDGKLELQIGRQSFVRASADTQLALRSNEPGFLQLELSAGRLAADIRQLGRGDVVELATPSGAVRIERDGYYRIDASDDGVRVVVRRGGQAEVLPHGAAPMQVATGEALELRGTAVVTIAAVAAPGFDGFDRWSYERTESFLAAPRSYAVPDDMYGAADLERYGSWRYVTTYGRVWVPSAVPVGWAPYTYGRWIADPVYGWSWVDYAPWGWAPFHYGRWVYAGYWAWAPGPVLAVPVYAPALVAFFGSPIISVGIGFPVVSWVALGWGEPLLPWWGPVGFVGRPCWRGWGGPRVVNNITINTGDVVNADRVRVYRNATVPGAVHGVPRDQFASRALDRVRVQQGKPADLQPIRGPLPVAGRAGAGGSRPPLERLAAASRDSLSLQRDGAARAPAARAGVRQDAAPPPALDRLRARAAPSAVERVGRAEPAAAGALSAGSRPPLPRSAFDAVRAGSGRRDADRTREVLRTQPSAPSGGMRRPDPGALFQRLGTSPAAGSTASAGSDLQRSRPVAAPPRTVTERPAAARPVVPSARPPVPMVRSGGATLGAGAVSRPPGVGSPGLMRGVARPSGGGVTAPGASPGGLSRGGGAPVAAGRAAMSMPSMGRVAGNVAR